MRIKLNSETIPTSSTATVSSIPLVPRLPQIPSSTGSSTPTQAVKTSTPVRFLFSNQIIQN